jgi:hypothetical protein
MIEPWVLVVLEFKITIYNETAQSVKTVVMLVQ